MSCISITRIFELDIQPTQRRKKELLYQAGIALPDQLIFVSINFNTDNIGDVLNQAGFNRNSSRSVNLSSKPRQARNSNRLLSS